MSESAGFITDPVANAVAPPREQAIAKLTAAADPDKIASWESVGRLIDAWRDDSNKGVIV